MFMLQLSTSRARTGVTQTSHPGTFHQASLMPVLIFSNKSIFGFVPDEAKKKPPTHECLQLLCAFGVSKAIVGAQGETRTPTYISTLAPEASASTNSATWAIEDAHNTD